MLIVEVIAYVEKVNGLDKSFICGEFCRVLGVIYIYVLLWFSGVGDLDEVIEVLESVIRDYSDESLNFFYLVEVYRRVEEFDKVLRFYKCVCCFKFCGLWCLEGSYYCKWVYW